MAQPPSCPFGAIHLEDRRGTRTYQALQYFRCARSEWLPAFYSGPLGPSSSRISYPSLRPDGQSSLTPSLHLRAKSRRFAAVALRSARLRASVLPNANSLRWALRWGPPSAADWIGKLGAVWFHSCAWLGRAIAPGANPAGRSGTGPYEESVTTSASSVGAAHLGRPPWRHPPPCGYPPVTSPPRSPPPGAPSGPAPGPGGSYSGCPPAFCNPQSRAPPGSPPGKRTGPA